MISIGTLCILINDGKTPELRADAVGLACRVAGYDLAEWMTVHGYDVLITRDEWMGRHCTRLTNLLPIGPDQSVEQREKEMTL